MHPQNPCEGGLNQALRVYAAALRSQSRFGMPLPWANPGELWAFLGDKPDAKPGDRSRTALTRHNKALPHGAGNTCWKGKKSTPEDKVLRESLKEALKQASERFKPTAQPDPATTTTKPSKSLYEAREENPKTKGLAKRIDNLQARLLREALYK